MNLVNHIYRRRCWRAFHFGDDNKFREVDGAFRPER
jgi:hypothetical protein